MTKIKNINPIRDSKSQKRKISVADRKSEAVAELENIFSAGGYDLILRRQKDKTYETAEWMGKKPDCKYIQGNVLYTIENQGVPVLELQVRNRFIIDLVNSRTKKLERAFPYNGKLETLDRLALYVINNMDMTKEKVI